MLLLFSIARILFAIAMLAFGLQHLVYGEFVTRLVPKLPASIPHHAAWAYLTGCLLIAAGVAILLRRGARTAAVLLGTLFFFSFLLLYVPSLLTTPVLGALWTNAGKALAMSGGAFLVAHSLSRSSGSIYRLLVPLSRFFLSAFLIVGGIQHFLYVSFVATLVPRWIPGHIFWTYFAGVALIAGGLGILTPKVNRPAALLTGSMIFLWVVLLHIPRALAAPHDSNETTAVFEAIAIGATAFLAARS
jgi:uncharacterized membrane protein